MGVVDCRLKNRDWSGLNVVRTKVRIAFSCNVSLFCFPCSVIPQSEVASVGVLVEFGKRIRSEMSPMLVKQWRQGAVFDGIETSTNAEKTYIL